MPGPTDVKPNLGDLAKNMGLAVYKEAYEKNRSLSDHLNALYPATTEEEKRDGLDAFQRLMAEMDIATGTDRQTGDWADEFGKFYDTEQTRSLIPEWLSRNWRKVSDPSSVGVASGTRDSYFSDDQALNTWSRQYQDATAARWNQQIAPAIPLSEVVARTTPIRGDAYRAFYLTTNAAQSRMVRITEGAEIPRAKLVGGDRTVRLYKFGRAIEASYEALRRMRIDLVGMHVQRMAVQAEIDKVAAVLDIIVNGDGNANTAATVVNLTTMDTAAVAGTLTLKGWIRFRMQFANPYFATTTLGQEPSVLQLFLLNSGSANQGLMSLPSDILGGLQPINPGLATGMRVGWTSDAPALKLVSFDRRIAVERVVEVGADISEVESVIINQTKILTLTEVEGYAVIDPNASKILNINA